MKKVALLLAVLMVASLIITSALAATYTRGCNGGSLTLVTGGAYGKAAAVGTGRCEANVKIKYEVENYAGIIQYKYASGHGSGNGRAVATASASALHVDGIRASAKINGYTISNLGFGSVN